MEDGSKEQFALHFNVSRISIKQSQLRQTNPWFDSNIERYWCNFQIHVARKPFDAIWREPFIRIHPIHYHSRKHVTSPDRTLGRGLPTDLCICKSPLQSLPPLTPTSL